MKHAQFEIDNAYATPVSEAKAQEPVAAQEPVEIGELTVIANSGSKSFDFDEYSAAYALTVGTHYLYAAPVASPQVVMPERLSASRYDLQDARADGWNDCLDEIARLNAAPVQQVSVPDGSRVVTTDWLKRIHRDLDACQKLIWANLRGCDPSYYEDAQERLREIDAMLAAPAAPAADAGLVEALLHHIEAIVHDSRVPNEVSQECAAVLLTARSAHRAKGVV